MNILHDNRFMDILRKHPEQKYYLAANCFCKLSEQVWLDEKLEFTVLHGYSHICSIIKNMEVILSKFTDEEIIKILGIDYIFILISATYVHDTGMKHFFGIGYSQSLMDKTYEDLSSEDKLLLRKHHNEIIDAALSSIKDHSSMVEFFGSAILQYLDQISSDKDLSNSAKILIRDKSRRIGIIAKYHNQKLVTLPPLISRLTSENKLALEFDEEFKLITTAALLQYGDTLDMAGSRIIKEEVETSFESLETIDYKDFFTLKKIVRSYLIDSISAKYDDTNSYFVIIFEMSACEKDVEEHYDYFRQLKQEYEDRLVRGENDCLTILEKKFAIKTIINCNTEKITPNSNKIKIPELFFTIKSEIDTPINDYLDSTILKISEESVLTYFKLFSTFADSFAGGKVYIGDSFENKEIEEVIEKYIFIEKDWNLDRNFEYNYSEYLSEKPTQILKNRRYVKAYIDYFKLYKKLNILSEVHYPIKYKNKIIGFINLHYKHALNTSDLNQKLNNIRKVFNSFGLEFISILNREILPYYIRTIDDAPFLRKENKKFIIETLENMFDEYGQSEIHLKKIPIDELKSILKISKIGPSDNNFYIKVNPEVLKDYYKLTMEGNIKILATGKWEIIYAEYARSCSIYITLNSTAIGSPLAISEFIQVFTYFQYEFPKFLKAQQKIAGFLIPLKSFVMALGGKSTAKLFNDNRTLQIQLIFPMGNFVEN